VRRQDIIDAAGWDCPFERAIGAVQGHHLVTVCRSGFHRDDNGIGGGKDRRSIVGEKVPGGELRLQVHGRRPVNARQRLGSGGR